MNCLALMGVVLCSDDPDAIRRQEEVVEQAALAVAQARQADARKKDIEALMAVYRTQAEALAAMTPTPPRTDEAERQEALSSLRQATALGNDALEARTIVADWLGPLAERLELLQSALGAAANVVSVDIASGMREDVRVQCAAVAIAAAYDATRADAEARDARLHATALEVRAPGGSSDMSTEVARTGFLAAERDAEQRAAASWALRERSTALCLTAASE